jgi:proteasome chaperone 3
MNIEQDPTGFSKSFSVKYNDDEFRFHKLEFDDRIIFNIQINGIMDTTFDLPINSKQVINLQSGSITNDDDIVAGLEPVILVGNHANLKIQIIATQLSKLFINYSSKPVILSIASKWFGHDLDNSDFDKLMWVSNQVKTLLS